MGDQTADLQYLGTHKNNGWHPNVYARLGSRDVHDRLGRRRSLSESPSSSNSKDSRRKRRKREDEDMCRPWRRQKVDAFTWRISDFSEDKRRRMPANVKTYDGTGDPDDHLKIFESAATIKNWPQPVWCHMFNSMLVGNAWNWFSKLPRRSIDGFKELRRAFCLNFTQRKKYAKNPVELARVKQRQGDSTSAYVEHYKDECIHVKACPEILKISGFMNGINNPELIKILNDMVPQTFDELMKRTRSFIEGEATAADSKKSYSNYKSQEQPRRQSNDQSSNRNNSYRNQRGGRGNDKYTPLTKTPKEILATECANFPKPPPMRTLEERRVGNGLDHLVKNIKEGKDKQKSGGHYDNHKRGRSTARSLYHPHQTVPETDPTEPPPAPLGNKGSDLEVDNLALEGVAPELAPKYEASPPRHLKERREKDSRRPPVFTRIGKKVVCDQTADLQYLGTHENNRWRTNVQARLGSRDVHDRLGRRRSISESPPSSDSEDSRRKRRKRVSSSSSDSSENEDEETGHWKSKNGYRNLEDEDMSRPWRRQKVDAFTRRISDFSKDKRRRMPANVKTYDGTEDAEKLRPKWEGPYEVTEALGNGAYKLRDMDGRELPRTWNICNLKRCYL
nr:reverse transcriptase domain-containing protein [Tanacetum cinerariifolium]